MAANINSKLIPAAQIAPPESARFSFSTIAPNRPPECRRVQNVRCQIFGKHYTERMILEKFPEVQQLSPSEKLLFVSELWNDLEAHPAEVPVSREIIAEIDRRMEHFRAHPEEFTTWEAVQERILGSRP